MDVDDLGAAAGGGLGGLVRWLRTPDGQRGLALALASGVGFGFTAGAVVRHAWPDVSGDVRWGIGFAVGVVSAVLTEPRMRRATAIEAHELTGFSIGGIPPFGHVRRIRTVMDPDLGRYETVWAAAGTANAVFPLTPATLRVLSDAVVTQIAVRPDEPRLPDEPRQNPPEEPTEQQAAGAPSGV